MAVLARQYPARGEALSDLATDNSVSSVRRISASLHLAPRCHRGRAVNGERLLGGTDNHHPTQESAIPLHLSQDAGRNCDLVTEHRRPAVSRFPRGFTVQALPRGFNTCFYGLLTCGRS